MFFSFAFQWEMTVALNGLGEKKMTRAGVSIAGEDQTRRQSRTNLASRRPRKCVIAGPGGERENR